MVHHPALFFIFLQPFFFHLALFQNNVDIIDHIKKKNKNKRVRMVGPADVRPLTANERFSKMAAAIGLFRSEKKIPDGAGFG